MAKILQLNFSTTGGKKTTLTVDEPRADLKAVEVNTAMQEIINADIFKFEGHSLDTALSARIVERIVTELIE
ncbi:DUF2922 domain-containing protein [Sporosarcina siberiensis]|uniref:DUF2922 domain-containing protein n=1 Tax=Sporosarcina siberiensis TaxID=1365606 RepID=A0ABW4SBM5_9BACL